MALQEIMTTTAINTATNVTTAMKIKDRILKILLRVISENLLIESLEKNLV